MDVIGQHCSFHHRCEYDYVECCGENEPSVICKCEHHTVQCIAYDRCMTACPTPEPTHRPSHNPTTARPTHRPSHNPTTAEPTHRPSHNPTTAEPTHRPSHSPTTAEPTHRPSQNPTTSKPTHRPTISHDDCPDGGTDAIGQHCSFHGDCEYDFVDCCGERFASTVCECADHRVQCLAMSCAPCPTPQPSRDP